MFPIPLVRRSMILRSIGLAAATWPMHVVAQTTVVTRVVSGAVADASGTKAAGALVVALDDKGQLVARALSGRNGVYALTIPTTAQVSLVALRVGFDASEPVVISPTSPAGGSTPLTLSSQVIRISSDKSKQKGVCGTPHDTESDVTRLWEEARKAIASTRLRFGTEEISSHITAFDRRTSRDAKTVQSETTRERDVAGSRPFSSLPPDSVARAGYVIETADDVSYYAPDAEVLLSSSFAESHCFGFQNSSSQHADRIGLTFKPKSDRVGVRDISGTFWFNRTSLELQSIEFRYTNVPTAYLSVAVGGEISFVRLPVGVWVISHWETRMPQGQIQSQIALQHSQARERTMVNVEALRVAGGLVTRVRVGTEDITLK